MKETLAVVLFFIGLFSFAKFGAGIPLTISQVTTNKTDLFTVSAEGKAYAKPDVAQINLGFVANGQSVSQVQSQANTTMNNVVSAVKALGITEKDIQTTNYNLRPDYDWSNNQQRIRGYIADVNVFVKVLDFNKINDVIDVDTTNGANTIGNLNFTVDNPEKYQAQARKEAISKAKLKAEDIARESGINLGRLINVSEGFSSPPTPMYATADKAYGIGGGGAPTQVEPGSSEISVSVSLSYETK